MTIGALPAAPYPPDLRAKGWRFEIDYERIAQSDTWALAQPEMRPWLLMLWTVAWQQTPCGSMSADDELIAARIGMDLATFLANRKILMRGWWKADDGRLYHPVISEQVVAMLLKKRNEAERKAQYRARLADANPVPAGVPRDNYGTTKDVPMDSAGSDDTGTGTGTGTKEESAAQAAPAPIPSAKAERSVTLTTFLAEVKSRGERQISGYGPVWTFAKNCGIPEHYIDLAWRQFKKYYTKGGRGARKRYVNWRGIFNQALEEQWGVVKLWYFADDECHLNAAGVQAERMAQASIERAMEPA